MNLKSQKGYSLIEIGVGIIIITVLLACSTSLFNGCFNIYRAVQQRNYVVSHAVSNLERLLQTDVKTLMTDVDSKVYDDRDELIEAVEELKDSEEGMKKLADGEYYVPADKVVGGFVNSPETNNMRITTKVRRVPTAGVYAYDDTVIRISVLVEYTVNPQIPGKEVPQEEILSYEISTIKVTKS